MAHTASRAQITAYRFPIVATVLIAATWATAQTPADLKGVWEPVNFGADLRLNDVFFVTPEIGYVSGDAGTILKTTDAGATWTPLLGGDPASQERPIERLFFVSPTVGWATQSAPSNRRHLYRTSDGENWEVVGNIEEHLEDLVFSSESEGIYVDDTQIWRSTDAGRSWSPVYTCAASAQIGGLTRQFECNLWKVHFATPSVAYALGDGRGDVRAAVIVKSTDGGASWSVAAVIENQLASEGGLFFVDESTGYATMRDGQAAFRTSDGGATWTGMPATALGRRIAFADPEIGWAMRYNQLSFTTDGGRRWGSRQIEFPAVQNAFSFPRRDIAYAVGDHGMIYRYRTVPDGTTVAANAIAFVAMPPLANSVIETLAEVETGVASIEAALAAGGAPAGAPAGSAARAWIEANVPGFAALETALADSATGLPALGRRHRNLNLPREGLRLLGELDAEGSVLASALSRLRDAQDAESVTAALAELSPQVEAAQVSVMAFARLPVR